MQLCTYPYVCYNFAISLITTTLYLGFPKAHKSDLNESWALYFSVVCPPVPVPYFVLQLDRSSSIEHLNLDIHCFLKFVTSSFADILIAVGSACNYICGRIVRQESGEMGNDFWMGFQFVLHFDASFQITLSTIRIGRKGGFLRGFKTLLWVLAAIHSRYSFWPALPASFAPAMGKAHSTFVRFQSKFAFLEAVKKWSITFGSLLFL